MPKLSRTGRFGAMLIVFAYAACVYDASAPAAPPSSRSQPNGEYGLAYFEIDGLLVTADEAVAANSSVQLVASTVAPASEIADVRSSNEAIATVSAGTSDGQPLPANDVFVNLQAHQPGVAQLELFDVTGQLLDEWLLTVKQPTSIQILAADDLTTLAGEPQFVEAVSFADSTPLLGQGGLTLTTTGPATAGGMLRLGTSAFIDRSDKYVFTPTAAGAAMVTLASGSAAASLTVEIVDASQITNLQGGSTGAPRTVSVTALSGSTPVFGAICNWNAPGLTITYDGGGWLGGPSDIYYAAERYSTNTDATCTIGSQQLKLTID